MTIVSNYEMSRKYEEIASGPSTSSTAVRPLPLPLGPDTSVERYDGRCILLNELRTTVAFLQLAAESRVGQVCEQVWQRRLAYTRRYQRTNDQRGKRYLGF